MRLFVAVNFTGEVKSRIIDIQEKLRAQCIKGNFSRPENLHLTLVFIGETPEEKLETLCQIIRDMKSSSFDVAFNRTGCFTHSGKELWWIGAGKDCPGMPLLESIHGQLLRRLKDAGFSADARPFNAHITLAREIKHQKPITLDCPEITVTVDRISLMKSEHVRGVLTYTEIKNNIDKEYE
jgi:2'-5' RNA ligase